MRRVLFLVSLILAITLTVGLAQPPGAAIAPAPPDAAVPPAAPPMPPAAAAEATLTQFEPLDAFPQVAQTAVRAVVHGSNWLTRMNQSQGRFLYGYRPALRQAMEGDHDLLQARATLALARAARFTGSERQIAVASQAVLMLLAATRIDPADPKCRMPIASSLTCNRVGFAGTLALCIYELPGADGKLIAEAERLCEFLHKQLRADGSVHYIDGLSELATKIEPAGVNEYPGIALNALAVSNRIRPAAWKAEALTKGMEHYRAWFKANPHPLLAATLTPAFQEYYLQTKSSGAAAAVFELNDWLAALQYPTGDARHPLWAGGFTAAAGGQAFEREPGCECGAYLESLASAYRLARLNADLTRAGRYKQAVDDTVQFLAALQYTEANTRHFENGFRANVLLGGFFFSPTDGNLRIDSTATAISGMLQYLLSGAAN
jgi:hypothetical protein